MTFLGFVLFVLYISQTRFWRSEEARNTNRHISKELQKSPISLVERPGKGKVPRKTENVKPIATL